MTQIEQWIREEGRQEEKRETARTMLTMGMSPEVIAKATHLPLEEILRMEKEINNKN